jgi:hypothetical protein
MVSPSIVVFTAGLLSPWQTLERGTDLTRVKVKARISPVRSRLFLTPLRCGLEVAPVRSPASASATEGPIRPRLPVRSAAVARASSRPAPSRPQP